MPDTEVMSSTLVPARATSGSGCRVAVVWIDWYPYHIARFEGIRSAAGLGGEVAGIELVGGVGVHAGLQFREELPEGSLVQTLMPAASWRDAGQLRLAFKLWRHLSTLKPRVLLVPGYYTVPAVAAAVWCRIHDSTSVLMTESTAWDHGRVWWKERLKGMLISALFSWAITGGKAHRVYLRHLGFPEDRIANFYDVVDNDGFRRQTGLIRKRTPSEYNLPDKYFLYVGRLAPEKNVETLLHSWISYRREGGTWSLVLVGDGPCANALQRMAADCGFAAEVHFVGHRGSKDLPAYYAFARCFVLPSTREPWGLVVNEAMASGLPVLVSDRCGCAEDLVASGRNGFVFDPSKAEELTYLLKEIERLPAVDQAQMSTASREIIREYSPSAFGKEVERIYTDSNLSTSLHNSDHML